MKEILIELNIRLPDIIAGIAGGVVNAVVFKRTAPWAFVGSVVVGAFTANYFGETVSAYIGMRSGAAAFLVGMAGMVICQSIVAAVPAVISKWTAQQNSGKPDGI